MTIAVLGGYGVGITMRVPRIPEAGETVAGGVLSREHGGKASNQAIAITRWGARAALISAIGDDADGRLARALWQQEGVDDTEVIVVEASTMAGIILVDADGENRIAIAAGALDSVWGARSSAPAVLRSGAAQSLVISLEVPHQAAEQGAQLAREAGIPVLLNPAPAENVPVELWTDVDVLIPNQTEARALLSSVGVSVDDDDLVTAQALARRCRGLVVTTCGADGAIIADESGARWIATPQVTAVDTTGAGDTFVGVLAAELAGGSAIDVAVDHACRAAAHSVTRRGVLDGLPYRHEILGAVA